MANIYTRNADPETSDWPMCEREAYCPNQADGIRTHKLLGDIAQCGQCAIKYDGARITPAEHFRLIRQHNHTA